MSFMLLFVFFEHVLLLFLRAFLSNVLADFLCFLVFFLCLVRRRCFDVVLRDGGALTAECHELLGDTLIVTAIVLQKW